MLFLALLALLQQPHSPTTPPSGDTTGYWQQRADYRIVARLDEVREALIARGELTYVNNSPDTLRELYLHQYLNAFRPRSAWSEADAREGMVRFQNLRDPHFAYERLTSSPTVNGRLVTPEYPGSPDSTVVRLPLPEPLRPKDSVVVALEWEARPSTLPRRQARRGRSYDFAQWYPKVAVYDRHGWEQRALVPAGEFYGEFGSFDVTLLVAPDQVIGATGVPVEGDPGWEGVRRWGSVRSASGAYGAPPPASAPSAAASDVPPGVRRVRFIARNVHHFGWSASPHYLYEGGAYVRREAAGAAPFAPYDTVSVHVLYRPGDEAQWGNGQAVARTIAALQWLEWLHGPYAYPQITGLHRIEGGGTEFPMLMMNGSASQGLILHEGGHIYTYGILANNEWRSGWMDEGLTSYQTDWAQGFALHERARERMGKPRPRLQGHRRHALVPFADEAEQMQQYRLDLLGRAEPIGTPGPEFAEYDIYTAMVYTRAKRMYGALRDVMGDSAFRAFLGGYYRRWALRHVDEHAMRAEAERAFGADLRWFFDQWVHRTGLIDYELAGTESRREGDRWITRAKVVKRGEYWHPMPVGARTSAGWTIVRAAPLAREQWVEIATSERPAEVRLDPEGATEDWNGRNDGAARGLFGVRPASALNVFDWPFLTQRDRERTIVAWSPAAWYSGPGGLVAGFRVRSGYQGWLDRVSQTAAYAARRPDGSEGARSGIDDVQARLQLLVRVENPTLPFTHRPAIGVSWEAGRLDGIMLARLDYVRDESRYFSAEGPRRELRYSLLAAVVTDTGFADPLRWRERELAEFGIGYEWADGGADAWRARLHLGAGLTTREGRQTLAHPYPRIELEAKRVLSHARGSGETRLRVFAGYSDGAPLQRTIHVSALDPVQTFADHLVRPTDGLLSHSDAHFVPQGGAGLRGYDLAVAAPKIVSANLEQAQRLATLRKGGASTELWAALFVDAGSRLSGRVEGRDPDIDIVAGAGLAARAQLWDRPFRVRLDLPLYMDAPELAAGVYRDPNPGTAASKRERFRWVVSFNELW